MIGKPFPKDWITIYFRTPNSINGTASAKRNDEILKKIHEVPAKWRNAMIQAIASSDNNKMCSLTTRIRDQHPILAERIQNRIDQFDHDNLYKIIQKI